MITNAEDEWFILDSIDDLKTRFFDQGSGHCGMDAVFKICLCSAVIEKRPTNVEALEYEMTKGGSMGWFILSLHSGGCASNINTLWTQNSHRLLRPSQPAVKNLNSDCILTHCELIEFKL